ncbi:MAG: DUF5107 domain-containing protein, partial [Cellulosilyticaceae bacterium]
TVSTIYPYTQQNVYVRNLEEQEVEVVRLENDYLKAIFIPSLGGKLWSLYDKVAKKELLYVNDVIRPSNLAVRNAWVSGGVEWNIGVIGHTPFTCDKLFVGTVEADGMTVLRMYEYERIRKVTYQMDFFLPDDSKFLLCRMRIVNPNQEMVPMYWWSNMAVPELENGRLVVDANSAYTNSKGGVYKVEVPEVNGVDISYPKTIPGSVDYFFDIEKSTRKYITQLDETGYGMIQTSTSRLEGRKLFVWGQTRGSQRWQNYLNDQAGNYIEIQAGLAKTQYGCLPMPAQSEWEWLEAYGAIQIEPELVQGDWKVLRQAVNKELESLLPTQKLENTLEESRETIALQQAKLVGTGSMFAAIENHRRTLNGESTLSEHLDFGQVSEENEWIKLMTQTSMGDQHKNGVPESYMMEETYYELLQKAVADKDKQNSHTWYHLGLNQLVRREVEEAIESFEQARSIEENAFNTHALAIAYGLKGDKEKAIQNSLKAMELRPEDIGLAKDCVSVLVKQEAYEILLRLNESLPEAIRDNARIRAYTAFAYAKCNEMEKAEVILRGNGWIEVEDIREGECFTSELWELIQANKENQEAIPFELDFRASV